MQLLLNIYNFLHHSQKHSILHVFSGVTLQIAQFPVSLPLTYPHSVMFNGLD